MAQRLFLISIDLTTADAHGPHPRRNLDHKSKEVCLDWNLNRKACSRKGPCTYHRLHECAVCGSRSHRGCDVHTHEEIFAALGKDMSKGSVKKGKGKGKKGGKQGKGGDRKDSAKQAHDGN